VIDLHCHIHPGVDDGCADEHESLNLARALVNAGVTKIAATSHVRPDKGWMNTRKGDADRLGRVKALIEKAGVPLEIVSGAEHYWDTEVLGTLDTLADIAVPYGNSKWILVETPYLGEPPRMLEVLHAMRARGFRVLLAHVERFPYLSDKLAVVEKLRAMGIAAQVNVGSLAGAYSRPQQKNAERLLEAGLVDVLAGDCHREFDVERNIVKGLACARKLVDAATLERLTVTNPQRILDDASPDRVIAA